MTFKKRILLEDHTALPSGYKADNQMHESLIHTMVCQCTYTAVGIIYCAITAHFKLSFIYIDKSAALSYRIKLQILIIIHGAPHFRVIIKVIVVNKTII